MADEKKVLEAQGAAQGAPDISERLDNAADLIDKTAEAADQKRQDTRKQLEEHAKSSEQRQSESEKIKSEAEKNAKSVAERKLAALSYAENYRERLRADKEKANKEKKERERREKEEAEARAKEERRARIEEMLRREQEELDARNAKSDEMLRQVKEAKEASEAESAPVEQTPVAEAPKAEEAPVAEAPKTEETPKEKTTVSFDQFKAQQAPAKEAAPKADEPLTFDLSDLGLEDEAEEVAEQDDTIVLDENGEVEGGENVAPEMPTNPIYPPYYPPMPTEPQKPASMFSDAFAKEFASIIREMRADRRISRENAEKLQARQAEIQQRTLDLMQQRQEASERARAEQRGDLHDILAALIADTQVRRRNAALGIGEKAEEAEAADIARTPIFSDDEEDMPEPYANAATSVPEIPVVTGQTHEEQALENKALMKEERKMVHRVRKQGRKNTKKLAKATKKQNKKLNKAAKKALKCAKKDKNSAAAYQNEALERRAEMFDNNQKLLADARRFEMSALVSKTKKSMKKDAKAYNNTVEKARKNGNYDFDIINDVALRKMLDGESTEPVARPSTVEPTVDESALVSTDAPAVAESAPVEQTPVLSKKEKKAEKKAKKDAEKKAKAQIAKLEKDAKNKLSEAKKLEKIAKNKKNYEQQRGEAKAQMINDRVDAVESLAVAVSVADEASLGKEGKKAAKKVNKTAKVYNKSAKKINKKEGTDLPILDKDLGRQLRGGEDMPRLSRLESNEQGELTVASATDEDSVNFTRDTDGAASAEGVRTENVALHSTCDNTDDASVKNSDGNTSPDTSKSEPSSKESAVKVLTRKEAKAQQKQRAKERKEAEQTLDRLEKENVRKRREIKLAKSYAARTRDKEQKLGARAEELTRRTELLSNLGLMIGVADAADLKKQKKKATRQMDAEVKEYNALSKQMNKAGVDTPCLDEDLSARLANGEPMPELLIVKQEEDVAETLFGTFGAPSIKDVAEAAVTPAPAAAGAVMPSYMPRSMKKGNLAAELSNNSPEAKQERALHLYVASEEKKLAKIEAKEQKEKLEALRKETSEKLRGLNEENERLKKQIEDAHAKTKVAHGKDAVRAAKEEEQAAHARLLNNLTLMIPMCAAASLDKEQKAVMKATDREVAEYNALAKALKTKGNEPTLLPKDLSERIAAGEPMPKIVVSVAQRPTAEPTEALAPTPSAEPAKAQTTREVDTAPYDAMMEKKLQKAEEKAKKNATFAEKTPAVTDAATAVVVEEKTFKSDEPTDTSLYDAMMEKKYAKLAAAEPTLTREAETAETAETAVSEDAPTEDRSTLYDKRMDKKLAKAEAKAKKAQIAEEMLALAAEEEEARVLSQFEEAEERRAERLRVKKAADEAKATARENGKRIRELERENEQLADDIKSAESVVKRTESADGKHNAAATELNARADRIANLSLIASLAALSSDAKKQQSTAKQIDREVAQYNKAASALSATGIQTTELPSDLAKRCAEGEELPEIRRVDLVETTETPASRKAADTARTEEKNEKLRRELERAEKRRLAREKKAEQQHLADVLAEEDALVRFTESREKAERRLEAKALSARHKSEREDALGKIRALEAENEQHSIRIRAEEKLAKRADTPADSISAKAEQLDERAARINNLTLIGAIAQSAALTDEHKRVEAQITREVKEYNALAKQLRRTGTYEPTILPENLAEMTEGGEPMPEVVSVSEKAKLAAREAKAEAEAKAEQTARNEASAKERRALERAKREEEAVRLYEDAMEKTAVRIAAKEQKAENAALRRETKSKLYELERENREAARALEKAKSSVNNADSKEAKAEAYADELALRRERIANLALMVTLANAADLRSEEKNAVAATDKEVRAYNATAKKLHKIDRTTETLPEDLSRRVLEGEELSETLPSSAKKEESVSRRDADTPAVSAESDKSTARARREEESIRHYDEHESRVSDRAAARAAKADERYEKTLNRYDEHESRASDRAAARAAKADERYEQTLSRYDEYESRVSDRLAQKEARALAREEEKLAAQKAREELRTARELRRSEEILRLYENSEDKRLSRLAAKAQKAKTDALRKDTLKKLRELERENAEQKKLAAQKAREASRISDASLRAEKKEDELVARGSVIRNLALMSTLAGAASLSVEERSAAKAMDQEVRSYNKTARSLRKLGTPAETLAKDLSERIASGEPVPTLFAPERRPEDVCAVDTASRQDTHLAEAEEKRAVAARERDERAMRYYEESVEKSLARSAAKKQNRLLAEEQKSARAKLSALKKESALYEASAEQKNKKAKATRNKQEALSLKAEELNERARRLNNLSLMSSIATAASLDREESRVDRDIDREVKSYNRLAREIEKKYGIQTTELPKDLSDRIHDGESMPNLLLKTENRPIDELTYDVISKEEENLENYLTKREKKPVEEPKFRLPERESVFEKVFAKEERTATDTTREEREERRRMAREITDEERMRRYAENVDKKTSRTAAKAQKRRLGADKKEAKRAISALRTENESLFVLVRAAQKNQKSENGTDAVRSSRADELNARARRIGNLSLMSAIAQGASLDSESAKLCREIEREVKEYNALSKKMRKQGVTTSLLPKDLGRRIENGESMPKVIEVKVLTDKPKNSFSPFLSEGVSQTKSEKSEKKETISPVKPQPERRDIFVEERDDTSHLIRMEEKRLLADERDAKAVARYEEKLGKKSAKEEARQRLSRREESLEHLRALKKENALREAKVEALEKKVKTLTDPYERELVLAQTLNERATLLGGLCSVVALSSRLELTKEQKKAKSAIRRETKSYNALARELKEEYQLHTTVLPKDLDDRVENGEYMPKVIRQHVDPALRDLSVESLSQEETLVEYYIHQAEREEESTLAKTEEGTVPTEEPTVSEKEQKLLERAALLHYARDFGDETAIRAYEDYLTRKANRIAARKATPTTEEPKAEEKKPYELAEEVYDAESITLPEEVETVEEREEVTEPAVTVSEKEQKLLERAALKQYAHTSEEQKLLCRYEDYLAREIEKAARKSKPTVAVESAQPEEETPSYELTEALYDEERVTLSQATETDDTVKTVEEREEATATKATDGAKARKAAEREEPLRLARDLADEEAIRLYDARLSKKTDAAREEIVEATEPEKAEYTLSESEAENYFEEETREDMILGDRFEDYVLAERRAKGKRSDSEKKEIDIQRDALLSFADQARSEEAVERYNTYLESRIAAKEAKAPSVPMSEDTRNDVYLDPELAEEYLEKHPFDAIEIPRKDAPVRHAALMNAAKVAKRERILQDYNRYMDEKMAREERRYLVSPTAAPIHEKLEDVLLGTDFPSYDLPKRMVKAPRRLTRAELREELRAFAQIEGDDEALVLYNEYLRRTPETRALAATERKGDLRDVLLGTTHDDYTPDFREVAAAEKEAKRTARRDLYAFGDMARDDEALAQYNEKLGKTAPILPPKADEAPRDVLMDSRLAEFIPTKKQIADERKALERSRQAELAVYSEMARDDEALARYNEKLNENAPILPPKANEASRDVLMDSHLGEFIPTPDEIAAEQKAQREHLNTFAQMSKDERDTRLYNLHVAKRRGYIDEGDVLSGGVFPEESSYFLGIEGKELVSALPYGFVTANATVDKTYKELLELHMQARKTRSYKDLNLYLKEQKKALAALADERRSVELREKKVERQLRVPIILEKRNLIARRASLACDALELLRLFPAAKKATAEMCEILRADIKLYNKTSADYRSLTRTKLLSVKSDLPETVLQGKVYERPRLAQVPAAPTEDPLDPTILMRVKNPKMLFEDAERESVRELDGKRRLSELRAVKLQKKQYQSDDFYAMLEVEREQERRIKLDQRAEEDEAIDLLRRSESRDHVLIDQYNRHEYKLFRQKKTSENTRLSRQIAGYERQLKSVKDKESKILVLFEILTCRRCIVENEIEMLKTDIAMQAKPALKKELKRDITKQVKLFNAALKRQTALTGEKYPKADPTIGKKILTEKPYTPLVALNTHGDLYDHLQKVQKLQTRQKLMKERQEKIDARLNQKHKKKVDKAKAKEPVVPLGHRMTKKQIKEQKRRDVAVIRLRYDEAFAALDAAIIARQQDYTSYYKLREKKRDLRRLKDRFAQLKAEQKRAIREEMKDNERYYKLLAVNFEKEKNKLHRADVEHLADIQIQLYDLMMQRNEQNRRLLELYSNTMAPNGVPMRFHKYYVSTLKKNCRREYRVARVIANLRNVSQQQKQALYNLLNERSRVRTDIDTAKKKARMYRLSGRALLAAKAEYKQNRAKLKKINKKLNFYMQVRTAADKRYVPFDIKALSWVFVVVLIGAFMGIYFFRENIIAYLTDLVANLPALFEKFGG